MGVRNAAYNLHCWADNIVVTPCDYCVSPSPNNWLLKFFILGLNLGSLDLGPVGTGDWGLGLGLDNNIVEYIIVKPKAKVPKSRPKGLGLTIKSHGPHMTVTWICGLRNCHCSLL